MLQYSIQKFPAPEQIGQFKGFQIATGAEPQRSSFYVALGLAMIKLMNRSQLWSEHNSYKMKMLGKLKDCMDILGNTNPFSIGINRFNNLMNQVSTDYIKEFSEYIESSVDSNSRDFIETCDLGARALIVSAMAGKMEEIQKICKFDPFNLEAEDRYLTNLVGGLGIKIRIIMDHDYKDFSYSQQQQLLLVLYRSANDTYFDLTHSLMAQVDTTAAQPPNSDGFPFFLADSNARSYPNQGPPVIASIMPIMQRSEIHTNQTQAREGDAQVLLNLIRKLATALLHDVTDKDELIDAIDKATDEYSVLNEGDLQKLRHKVQPQGSIAVSQMNCYHNQPKCFKTDCGFSHCIDCFKDKILRAISKCPCKEEIKMETKMAIIGQVVPKSTGVSTYQPQNSTTVSNPAKPSNSDGSMPHPPSGGNVPTPGGNMQTGIVPPPMPPGGNPPIPGGNTGPGNPPFPPMPPGGNPPIPGGNTGPGNPPFPTLPPGGNPPIPGGNMQTGIVPPPPLPPGGNIPIPGGNMQTGIVPPPLPPGGNIPIPGGNMQTGHFPPPLGGNVPGNLANPGLPMQPEPSITQPVFPGLGPVPVAQANYQPEIQPTNFCLACNTEKAREEFTIECSDHFICNACRKYHFQSNPNNCPWQGCKFYSPEEKYFLSKP